MSAVLAKCKGSWTRVYELSTVLYDMIKRLDRETLHVDEPQTTLLPNTAYKDDGQGGSSDRTPPDRTCNIRKPTHEVTGLTLVAHPFVGRHTHFIWMIAFDEEREDFCSAA